MASDSSRSPRDARESTNDPLEFCKGDAQLGMNSPRRDGGPENAPAFEKAEKTPPYKPLYDVDKS